MLWSILMSKCDLSSLHRSNNNDKNLTDGYYSQEFLIRNLESTESELASPSIHFPWIQKMCGLVEIWPFSRWIFSVSSREISLWSCGTSVRGSGLWTGHIYYTFESILMQLLENFICEDWCKNSHQQMAATVENLHICYKTIIQSQLAPENVQFAYEVFCFQQFASL